MSLFGRLFGPKKAMVKEPEKIIIPLQDLAQIWLPYNEKFEPLKQQESQKPKESHNQGAPQQTGLVVAAAPETESAQTATSSSRFYQTFVAPYREVFEQQNALAGTEALIKLLDEYGDCPSLVMVKGVTDTPEETSDLYNFADIFSKVTLADHTFRVAELFLKQTSKKYQSKVMAPMSIVIALGHDIGKIPALRASGLYSKGDHAMISGHKIREIFREAKVVWIEDAIKVIETHHESAKDEWIKLFRAADGKAREMEIVNFSAEITIKAWDQWFNVTEYVQAIGPRINIIESADRWDGCSLNGTVYFQSYFLVEAARKLAVHKKVIDLKLLRQNDRGLARKAIVSTLRNANIITSVHLREREDGKSYWVWYANIKRKTFLVPMKLEAFGDPAEIEKRKDDRLPVITDITTCD